MVWIQWWVWNCSHWKASVQIPFRTTFWSWFWYVFQKSDLTWFAVPTTKEPSGFNLYFGRQPWTQREWIAAWILYLKQIKDIGSIQSVVAQPVQQLHLSARGEILERCFPERVGLPLFQFPAVTDDVIEIAAERLGAAREKEQTGEKRGEVRWRTRCAVVKDDSGLRLLLRWA